MGGSSEALDFFKFTGYHGFKHGVTAAPGCLCDGARWRGAAVLLTSVPIAQHRQLQAGAKKGSWLSSSGKLWVYAAGSPAHSSSLDPWRSGLRPIADGSGVTRPPRQSASLPCPAHGAGTMLPPPLPGGAGPARPSPLQAGARRGRRGAALREHELGDVGEGPHRALLPH
jgi:hypothetical protein